MMEVGMKVRWVGETKCGKVTGVLIARGDIREVVRVRDDGLLWLSGRDNHGVFGACDPENVEVVS